MATVRFNSSRPLRSQILAGLSYLGALCFLPLMVNDRDEFILFHARQGLVLWGWSVLAGFSLLLPGVGKAFFLVSTMVVVIMSITGIVSVATRRAWKLPGIYILSKVF